MQKTGFYSGWKVLAGSFISAALAIGFTTYIVGMFTVPVTEELGISRTTYNNGAIGLMIGIALASPIVGKLLDLYSARRIMALSALAFGGSLMAISRLESLWISVLLLAGPLAFGVAACGVLGANTVVVRWFSRRRGQAMGILALSTSVGGFLSQPLTAALIETFGWRDALFLIGLGTMILFLLLNGLAIRNRPASDLAGYPDEFAATESAGTTAETADPLAGEIKWTNKQLFTNRNFWLVSLAVALFFGVDQAVLISQVPYFQDIGFDLQTTSLLVAIKTISAIGGKLIVGYLADKVDLRVLFLCVASCNIILLGVYILQPGFWVLLAAVSVLGVAVGGVFPVWTTITAWLFGTRSYGSVMGLMAVIMQPVAVVAIRYIGEVHDRTGSYVMAFATFIALVIVSIILMALVRPPTSTTPSKG